MNAREGTRPIARQLARQIAGSTPRQSRASGSGESIFALDARIIRWASNQGWAAMARSVSGEKVAKERAVIGSSFSPSVRLVLEFLGAYRKLVLEYMIQFYGARIDPAPYAQFLQSAGKASVLDAVSSIALGSTRLTSDYDLTLAGPAVHAIMLGAVEQLRQQTQTTSSFLFDSNLYIAPDLILCPFVESRLRAIGDIRVLESATEPGRATPVPPPQGSAFVALERESILRKIGKDDAHLDEDEIMARYRRLAEVGARLDGMLYRSDVDISSGVSADDFFAVLLEMNALGMEAYHGLSTILMVVNGMQAGQAEQVNAMLGVDHKLNAALENVIDLTNHWAGATGKTGETPSLQSGSSQTPSLQSGSSQTPSLLSGSSHAQDRETRLAAAVAKVGKYAARIVHCLDAAGVESELKETLRDPSALRGVLDAYGALDMAAELGIPVNA